MRGGDDASDQLNVDESRGSLSERDRADPRPMGDVKGRVLGRGWANILRRSACADLPRMSAHGDEGRGQADRVGERRSRRDRESAEGDFGQGGGRRTAISAKIWVEGLRLFLSRRSADGDLSGAFRGLQPGARPRPAGRQTSGSSGTAGFIAIVP